MLNLKNAEPVNNREAELRAVARVRLLLMIAKLWRLKPIPWDWLEASELRQAVAPGKRPLRRDEWDTTLRPGPRLF